MKPVGIVKHAALISRLVCLVAYMSEMDIMMQNK